MHFIWNFGATKIASERATNNRQKIRKFGYYAWMCLSMHVRAVCRTNSHSVWYIVVYHICMATFSSQFHTLLSFIHFLFILRLPSLFVRVLLFLLMLLLFFLYLFHFGGRGIITITTDYYGLIHFIIASNSWISATMPFLCNMYIHSMYI